MFSSDITESAKAHAMACYPNESCGLVVDGVYQPWDNVSTDPVNTFVMNPEALLQDNVQALVHSHPQGDAYPSVADIEQQMATDIPWGIVSVSADGATAPHWFGDGIDDVPLEGRGWRFGPTGSDGKGDCYAVIRDWYWQKRGIRLREVPRDWQGYIDKTPWYTNLMTSYGWKQIEKQDVVEGDVILVRILQSHINHAILFLNDGLCLQHLQGCLSRREPFGEWAKHARICLRYAP